MKGKIIQIVSGGRTDLYALTDEGIVYMRGNGEWVELDNRVVGL